MQTVSREKPKKNKLSLQERKVKIYYERLKRAYDWSWDDMAERFNMSRQGASQLRNRKKINAQEVIDLFPDINIEWAEAETLEDIKHLPVRQNQAEIGATADDLKDKASKGELSRQEVKELLGQIEGFVRILKDRI